MSTPELLAIHFIVKLRRLRHTRWLREINDEYDSLRSSNGDDEELTNEIWVNSPRPPLIKRQSRDCVFISPSG